MTHGTVATPVGRFGSLALTAIGLGANMVLQLALVPVLGAYGACILMTCSTVIMAVALIRSHSRLTRIPAPELLLPRRVDVQVVASRADAARRGVAWHERYLSRAPFARDAVPDGADRAVSRQKSWTEVRHVSRGH